MDSEKYIRKLIREQLENYDNVKFSDEFYKKDENMIKYLTKTYLQNLDDFITFYNKYNPKGIRVFKGVDIYEESKSVADKIMRGEIYIDDVFTNPDNPLRNVVMLMFLDVPALKRRNKTL